MIANGTNTDNVITSCKILSCPSDNCVYPIRFAGTWIIYSKKAIPQLMIAATYHLRSFRFLRCMYHANVMKRLDRINKPAVRRTTVISLAQRQEEGFRTIMNDAGTASKENFAAPAQ